jgi:hypothetical protein
MANLLKMADVQSIISLHARGWSGRKIARELGIDRETVGKYLEQAGITSKPASALAGIAEGGHPKPATAPAGIPGPVDSKPATAPAGIFEPEAGSILRSAGGQNAALSDVVPGEHEGGHSWDTRAY